jgi:pimeloyl-ACP methyl ester carboxylesterase
VEVRTTDGRVLSYVVLGDPDGTPVIALDGPGSRALARAAAPAARDLGVRVIAPDRPGFLGSTPAPGRTIADWAADAIALADDLGLDRFGLLAQSAGTPFALVVATRHPERVDGVALCGGIVPLGEPGALDGTAGPMRPLFVLARRAPFLVRPFLGLAARNPEKAAERALKDLPAKDAAAMERPELLALHRETTAQIMGSPDAFAHEVRLVTRPWGFALGDVRAPVGLWVGAEDHTHPPSMSAKLAARLPEAEVHVVPGAATFGLLEAYPDALRFAARR